MDTICPTNPTSKRKKRFLANFAKLGNITYAAKAAGIDRTCHYDWLEKDEAYAERFHSAQEEAADLLEAEVLRRGVKGVIEPVFYKGEICGRVRKYSDVLLIFLLKGTRPEKFRDKMEISDPQGRSPLLGALEDLWQKVEAGRGDVGIEADAIVRDGSNGRPINALSPGNCNVIDITPASPQRTTISLRPSDMTKGEDDGE